MTFDHVGHESRQSAITFSASEGRLAVMESTLSSFKAPVSAGPFPAGHSLEAIDANGDGRTGVVGRMPITGDLRVALSRMAAPMRIGFYCAIHAWAFDNGYRPFTSAGGCPS